MIDSKGSCFATDYINRKIKLQESAFTCDDQPHCDGEQKQYMTIALSTSAVNSMHRFAIQGFAYHSKFSWLKMTHRL